jgi:hypothetical protein
VATLPLVRAALALCLLASCASRARAPRESGLPQARGGPPPGLSERDRERIAREVVIIVVAGERFWRESCAVAGVEGLCVERARVGGGCGPRGEQLARRPRGRTAERARMHFRAALERYERAGLAGGDAEAAALTARLRLADDDLEGLLGLGFPAGLDFVDDEPRALRELSSFRHDLDGRTLGLRRAYGSLAGTALAVTALARETLLFAHVAAILRRAHLPRRPDEDGDELVAGFCRTMAEVAQPWQEAADRRRADCADEAARLGAPLPASCAP